MPDPTPMDPDRRKKLGNPGKRGQPRRPDGGVDKVLRPPRHLGEIGKREWRRVWLAGADWLDVGCDSRLVTRLCEWYEIREYYKAVADADPMVPGSKGQPRVNPAATEVHRCDADLLRMEALLGLTPSIRERWGFKVKQPESKLDELTRRRRQERRTTEPAR